MTAEEWKSAEESLRYVGDRVDFKIDGYMVTVIVMPYKPLQNKLMICVNNEVEIKVSEEDNEIKRKFYQKHKRNVLSAKEIKEIKKLGKKSANKLLKKGIYCYYENFWGSFRLMKAHFIRNCDSIEMVYKGKF